ncbi:NUDIX domain-containing protein [Flagellimonas sp.]|uniref:NUDIX domain-containing protein n=1 Tax=Flagellimonas sp. TaxID=2058762 RepID=UPI0034AF524A
MKKVIKSRLVAVHGTKVMVLKKNGKPRKYTLPGGIKKGKETEAQALVRETSEEIKLKLTKDQVQFYLSLTKMANKEQINKNYFYTFLKPQKIAVKETHKFDSIKWENWKMAREFMDKSDRLAVTAYFKSIRRKEKNKKHNEHQISSRIAM